MAVLFGGPSFEHEVSCVGARSVAAALRSPAYADAVDVVLLGMTRDGRLLLVPPEEVDRPSSAAQGRPIDDALPIVGRRVELRRPEVAADGALWVTAVDRPETVLAVVDLVFPLMHGPFGEDGTVQGLLESMGVPYVGCGVLASAVGMDKIMMKRALVADGLPVTPYVWFDQGQWERAADPEAWLAGEVAGLRYPLFVKPANQGSSIGITRVTDPGRLAEAVRTALAYDHLVLVEQGVHGRELECGVLGGLDPVASVSGEVTVRDGWFDFDQKYLATDDPMIVPAPLDPKVHDRIRELSVRAFRAIGAWGLARVDVLYDEVQEEIYINEVNTMPGFTAYSMYPKVWAAEGLAYPELVLRQLELARERFDLMRRRLSPEEVR